MSDGRQFPGADFIAAENAGQKQTKRLWTPEKQGQYSHCYQSFTGAQCCKKVVKQHIIRAAVSGSPGSVSKFRPCHIDRQFSEFGCSLKFFAVEHTAGRIIAPSGKSLKISFRAEYPVWVIVSSREKLLISLLKHQNNRKYQTSIVSTIEKIKFFYCFDLTNVPDDVILIL